ncbi:MAG: metallophosphoesterase family protein [Promethearchaeota archaeon]
MQIGIISDTHLSKNADSSKLMDKIKEIFEGVELIIHAGDVTNKKILDELSEIATVIAVAGNMDDPSIYNMYGSFKIIELFNKRIAISHIEPSISLLKAENIDICVSGHTHVPQIREDPEGILFLNPGSPTQPRTPPPHKMYRYKRKAMPSVIILELDEEYSGAFIYTFKT